MEAAAWRAGHRVAIGAILALSVTVAWWSRAPEISAGGDEATYVILSRSLEHGRYRDEFLRGTPPHAKYPPGIPIWIALIRRIAGPNLDAVRAANILLLALTALILGDALRRMAGPWIGVAAVALTALPPPLLSSSGTVLSEVPYAFLATLAVWLTLVADSEARGPWATAAALAAALASFLTRTVGFTVVVAVIAWLLLLRRWTYALWSALVSSAVVAGWLAYTAHASAAGGVSYADNLRHIASAGPGGAAGFLVQVGANARSYLLNLPWSLGVPTLPGTLVDNVLWLLVLGVSGIAGVLALFRKWPAAAAHLLLSIGVLLAWPWPIDRLITPVIPLIVAAVLTGGFVLARRLGGKAQQLVPLLLAVPLSFPGLISYAAHDTNHRCDHRDATAFRCLVPLDRSIVAAAQIIRDSAPPDAVIATAKPATIFYFSGHRTVHLLDLLRTENETGSLDWRSEGVDWILLTNGTPVEHRAATRLLDHYCDGLVVSAPSPRATLLLSATPAAGASRNACPDLQLFLREPPD